MTKVLQSLTTFELLCGLNSFPVPSQQMTMFFGILGIWVCLLIAVVLLCCPGNTRAQGEENVKLPQKFGRVKPDCMVCESEGDGHPTNYCIHLVRLFNRSVR